MGGGSQTRAAADRLQESPLGGKSRDGQAAAGSTPTETEGADRGRLSAAWLV